MYGKLCIHVCTQIGFIPGCPSRLFLTKALPSFKTHWCFSKAPFPEKNFTVNLHWEPALPGFALVSQRVCSVFALPICVFFSPAIIFKSLPCHWCRENVMGDRLGGLMYIGLCSFHLRPTYTLLFPSVCSLLVPMEWVEKDTWVPPVLSSTFSPHQLFAVNMDAFSLLWDSPFALNMVLIYLTINVYI